VRLDCCIVLAGGVPLARITSGASRSSCTAADCVPLAWPEPIENRSEYCGQRPSRASGVLAGCRSAELSFQIVLRVKHQHADPPHRLGLLHVRSEGPCAAAPPSSVLASPHVGSSASGRLSPAQPAIGERRRLLPRHPIPNWGEPRTVRLSLA
jgi:hypothetical protein